MVYDLNAAFGGYAGAMTQMIDDPLLGDDDSRIGLVGCFVVPRFIGITEIYPHKTDRAGLQATANCAG